MRTVFLGTSPFAVEVLRRLAQSAHRPVLVVTRPDRPRGRGRRVSPPPVATAARELGIALDQPASVNDDSARRRIADARPEMVCVVAFGALIKEPLLSEHPIRNVHPSLLPRWRGAAPIERALMAGDEVSGVSVMQLTAGLDSGPVCAQGREPIGPHDTYETLAARLSQLGADLLIETLDSAPPCEPQDDSAATYAEKISSAERKLDPRRTAAELERTVRALTPHIGAFVELADGAPLGVREARVRVRDGDGDDDGPPAGTLSLEGPVPVLGCAEGALELTVVQPAGKRAMRGEDFLRGYRG